MKALSNLWLIWSIEHDAWWRPNSNGYTLKLEDAGKYTFEQAFDICHGANEHETKTPNEAMCPAWTIKALTNPEKKS